MNTTVACAMAVALVGISVAPRVRHASTASHTDRVLELPAVELPGWLAGCWAQQSGAMTVEEFWMAPKGGVMLGMGRTSKGEAVVEYEHTRIYQRGDSLVYHARPSGQSEAEFVAPGVVGESVTFSNPEHDFPQRVIYRRSGTDSLVARVEGTANGRTRGVDFKYHRERCPGA